MIYTILFEADKHWGAGNPEEQYRSSYVLKRFLEGLKVDLFISLGDFYETKLLLNSKSSVYALRDMHDKAEICRKKGIPMRVIRGTLSHDYDQLNAFSNLMHDPSYNFKCFNQMTIEETLPGLNIMYCPDENVLYKKYLDCYFTTWLETTIHLAACHGNFDVIMPQIAIDAAEAPGSNTLVFRYHDMCQHILGPIIAGHWHDCPEFERLYYVGSPDRWKFGETNPKGYIIVRFNTETNEYQVIRVHNFLEERYVTYEVYTSLYRTPEEYQNLVETAQKALDESPGVRIRFKICIDEQLEDTDAQILNLKFQFTDNKRVSFDITNEVKARAVKEAKQQLDDLRSEYGFVLQKNASPAETIHRWLTNRMGRDYTLEQVKEVVDPELEKRG